MDSRYTKAEEKAGKKQKLDISSFCWLKMAISIRNLYVKYFSGVNTKGHSIVSPMLWITRRNELSGYKNCLGLLNVCSVKGILSSSANVRRN